MTQPQTVYVQSTPPSKTLGIVALIAGISGTALGLVPILFFLALPLGVTAVVCGWLSWRAGRALDPPRRQGRAGLITGLLALTLGIIGFVIVQVAVDDLDEGFDCLEEADTAAEIEACG